MGLAETLELVLRELLLVIHASGVVVLSFCVPWLLPPLQNAKALSLH